MRAPVSQQLPTLWKHSSMERISGFRRLRTASDCGRRTRSRRSADCRTRPPQPSARPWCERRGRIVLVSMGGIPWSFSGLERVAAARDVTVVVPGGSTDERRFGSVITVPHRSRFYHPDLMHAADGVVGKLGYSTVAEAWSNNLGMGWIRQTDVSRKRQARELGGEKNGRCRDPGSGAQRRHLGRSYSGGSRRPG